MTKSIERDFSVNGQTFAAQQWLDANGEPVLALHGWLDNSESFVRLAPMLNDLNLLALDMAGHGRSCHRLGFAPYNIWEDITEILTIADTMGWQKFSIIGHSRGAIIGALLAGAFPERVNKLVLIEGIFAEPTDPSNAPKKLANSIVRTQELSEKSLRVFQDIDSAIKARVNGLFPLSEQAAKALIVRGVKKIPEGYTWSTDQRLFAPSAIGLSSEQMNAFIHAIAAPTKVILATDGMNKIFPTYKYMLEKFTGLDVVTLAGGHHLHMEEQAGLVAEIINDFFNVS